MATRAEIHRCGPRATVLLFFAVCWTPLRAAANEPLHVRIDRAIELASFGGLSPLANDGDFLRRIYLDLAGMIPPADVAREFLDDDSPEKRTAIIERLLNSPRYVRHMANVFDVILMERRRDKHVKADEWQKYLRNSMAQNKPWNQIARELLAADGTDAKIRAAAKFYLDREGETNLLTRDVGRVFFGLDLQCCQCHDHPIVDNYYQADYYGIFAFLNRGFLFTDKDKKVFYAEKADGDVEFTSVFTEEEGRTRPRLPGDLEITEPIFEVGGEYEVKPADKKRPVPKYSRRARLAELATDGRNQAFNRNIVNRLWAHMMGQGLVSPLDLQHADNPPAHPELLELLAADFVSMKYNLKAFLRELALTSAYQRSLESPAAFNPQDAPSGDQLSQSADRYERRKQTKAKILAEFQEAEKEFNQLRDEAHQIYLEFNKAGTAVAAALKKSDEATKTLGAAKQKLAAKQEIARSLGEAATKALAAAAQLADDPELTQAAGIFRSRAETLTGEAAAAQKSLDDVLSAFNESQQALAAARASAAPIQRRFEQANVRIGQLRAPLMATAHKLDGAEVALQDAKVQLDDAQKVSEHAQLVLAAEQSGAAYRTCQTDLGTSRETLDKSVAELPRVETQLVDAQREHDEATRLLRESKEQQAAKAAVAQLVAEAAASAELASKKLPKDGELKQAFDAVKTRSDQVNSDVARLQDASDQRKREAEVVGARLAAAQQTARSTKEQLTTLRKKVTELTALLPELEDRAKQARLARDQSDGQLSRHLSRRFFTGSLQALTPEQMAWSVMQASGALKKQRQAAVIEIDKKLPLDDKNPNDPLRLAERKRAEDEFVYDKLKGSVSTFVKLFGHAAGQPQSDFFATVDQALFFANAGTLQSWLSPGGGNLTDRLNKLDDPQAIAEELYISVLTRRPKKEEVADVVQYLGDRLSEKKADALKEMAWALITSAEFRFSH